MRRGSGGRLVLRGLLPATACAVLFGCGGGSPGAGPAGGGAFDSGPPPSVGAFDPLAGLVPTPPPTEFRHTARFGVNVDTGEVSVEPGPAEAASRAVLAGTVVDFDSSLLFDQAGDSGLKVLRVSLRNQSGLTVGRTADGSVTGLRVLFSDFRPLSGPNLDLRDRTQVTSWAGNGSYSSTDGALDQASFQGGVSVAAGDGSVVFVSDHISNRIRRIEDGTVNTIAISEELGGQPLPLNRPFGLGYNPIDGSLLVCDSSGHRIRRVAADGETTTICGNGVAGFIDGPGNTARCNNPAGMAIGPQGQIYFSEGAGHRVRQVLYTGSNTEAERRLAANYQVTTIAGSGIAGFRDGTSNTVQFNSPIGLTWGDGHLYVADAGNRRLRRVSLTGEVITIAGTGVNGTTDGYGDAATFRSPVGICWTSNGLVVADNGAHLVRLCSLRSNGAPSGSPSSWVVRRLAGNGIAGITDGTSNTVQFNQPFGVTEDGAGNLYVADYGNNRVRRITTDLGGFTLGQPGGASSSDAVQLVNATGIAPRTGFGANTPFVQYSEAVAHGQSTATADWWFSVPDGVRAFDFEVIVESATDGPATPGAGTVTVGASSTYLRTLAGGTTSGMVDGVAAQARFSQIFGIAIDTTGNVFVSDFLNHNVRRIGVDGRVTTLAGVDGTSGSTNGSGDVAKFNTPGDLAVSPDGHEVFVTEQNGHRVRRLALIPGGDPTRSAHWVVSTVAGTGVSPGVSLETNGLGDVATLEGPYGLCRDSVGTLYVTENQGHRIRRIQYLGGDPAAATSYLVSTYAGSGADGTSNGTGTAAQFSFPASLAIDRIGNLYVSDSTGIANGSVRKITPDRAVTTLASSMHYPRGVAVDTAGFVYVVEPLRHVVVRLTADGATRRVVAGLTSASGSADGPGDVARLHSPNGLARDVTGNLYISDGPAGPCRVRIVQRVIQNGRPGEPVSQDF